ACALEIERVCAETPVFERPRGAARYTRDGARDAPGPRKGWKPNLQPFNLCEELRAAIGRNDLGRVEALLTSNPELHQVLIDDVPVQAVAQPGRTAMMELLVRHGADVNGLRWGWFPVLFTACENIEPEPLGWLLDHGADPNRGSPRTARTALDYVIDTY